MTTLTQPWWDSLMNERISIDPKVCHGAACVRGTRIRVRQIVQMLANGDSADDLLSQYPSLEREDIPACLEYADSLSADDRDKDY